MGPFSSVSKATPSHLLMALNDTPSVLTPCRATMFPKETGAVVDILTAIIHIKPNKYDVQAMAFNRPQTLLSPRAYWAITAAMFLMSRVLSSVL
jgi:hypothetical protein